MRTCVMVLGAVVLLSGVAWAGPETIIKQRAKELRDQNNARQGVPPATPPSSRPTTAPAQTTIAATPQQSALARLQADLAAFKTNTPATTIQKQQLARDLMALVPGPTRPSQAAVAKFAESLAAAMTEKPLSATYRSRLVQDLEGALARPNTPQPQMQAIINDVQAVFQANGMARPQAAALASDLKAILAEIQTPAK